MRIKAPKIVKRPTEIWEKPCKDCPSAHFPPDPESIDILNLYKKGEITYEEVAFPCGWRPSKLCRGVCDKLEEIKTM